MTRVRVRPMNSRHHLRRMLKTLETDNTIDSAPASNNSAQRPIIPRPRPRPRPRAPGREQTADADSKISSLPRSSCSRALAQEGRARGSPIWTTFTDSKSQVSELVGIARGEALRRRRAKRRKRIIVRISCRGDRRTVRLLPQTAIWLGICQGPEQRRIQGFRVPIFVECLRYHGIKISTAQPTS